MLSVPDSIILYSTIMVGSAFVLTAFSLRRIDWFPGTRSRVAGVSILVGWYAVLAAVLFFFRLPYSLSYLSLGFALSLVWLVGQSYFLRRMYRLCLAYVPLGRAEHVHEIEGVNWVRLDQPAMPEGMVVDAIVADLHAPGLTQDWQKFLAHCALQRRVVFNIRQAEESLTGRVKIRHMYENDLGSLLPSESYSLAKRILESALVLAVMPIVLPIIGITAIAIKLESPGGAMFQQRRVGQFGREFTIYKLRSMCKDSEKDGAKFAAAGDMRVTRIGKFIRKTRIDELPQFFNVLKGDMALIGPRPEQKAFVNKFEDVIPFYNYRHIVKPGITGWAQVVHGYAADADETQVKIEHDFFYIKYFSFWLDLLIVFKTIRTMLTGFGSR